MTNCPFISDRLRMSYNSTLRKIFGPKRDEIMGEQRRQHSKELHEQYTSPNIT
jgi:hypothetical protein